MQKKLFVFAYFFSWTDATAQQYPFVQYTPKDGLPSNRVKNIYYDYKWLTCFSALNRSSVYDGTRFATPTIKTRLPNYIVTALTELEDKAIRVVMNTSMPTDQLDKSNPIYKMIPGRQRR